MGEIHGRVRSLLEVGTGFHGELSGRENAYLSGSILGMSKNEIDRKFDEIVAFAEIDKFIDTPVKHYSSGMYVRLAFAVAAHLEPEILLVDEVLAVGDINFQKKCLGKMGDVAHEGRTIVLVSHQLNQIRRLAHRVVWIETAASAKTVPLTKLSPLTSWPWRGASRNGAQNNRATNTKGRFLKWEIVCPTGDEPHVLNSLDPVTLEFTSNSRAHPKGPPRHRLLQRRQQLIWARAAESLQLEIGKHNLCYTFPMLPLRPGPYSWQVSLYDEGQEWTHGTACRR